MKDRIDDALHFFEELKTHCLKPGTTPYNLIISGLGKAQRYMKALILFNEMENNGYVPNLFTHDSSKKVGLFIWVFLGLDDSWLSL